MFDREQFYKVVEVRPFARPLTDAQVEGCDFILKGWEARKMAPGMPAADVRHLAYCLATTFHETDRKMQPIEEYGRGAGRDYGRADPATGLVYYGRGYVQLTWRRNYELMGRLLGVDLLGQPERALEPAVAADIMFTGMERGLFTGVGLARYFNATTDDPVNARKIINGLDCAGVIAGHHAAFLQALGGYQAQPVHP